MKNKQSITQAFKAYPKVEQVRQDETQVAQLNARGSRIIHHFILEHDYYAMNYASLDSHRFFEPLEKLKLIQELKLKIFQHSAGTISKDFSEKLRYLSSLRTLNLQFGSTATGYFSSASWFLPEGILHLANALGDLKRLSKLSLNFKSCSQLDDKCFMVLFKGLKRLKSLKSLHLDLSGCEKITEKTFKSLASLLKNSFISLEELFLKLENPTILASALEFLASALPHLTRLKKLGVPRLTLQISQEADSDNFLFSIHHLESLRELYLNLSSFSNDMTTLEILATSLESLTELRSLSLNLMKSEEEFSLQEMEMLTQSFKSFPSLEYLALDFRKSPYIEAEAFENLSAALEGLSKLSEVCLSFAKCLQVGDADVESLIERLEKLPNLSFVNFDFVNCSCGFNHEHYNRLQLIKNIEGVYFACEKSQG